MLPLTVGLEAETGRGVELAYSDGGHCEQPNGHVVFRYQEVDRDECAFTEGTVLWGAQSTYGGCQPPVSAPRE